MSEQREPSSSVDARSTGTHAQPRASTETAALAGRASLIEDDDLHSPSQREAEVAVSTAGVPARPRVTEPDTIASSQPADAEGGAGDVYPNPRFGKFELLELLSSTPNGVVYKARQAEIPDRVIALKVIADSDPTDERVARFRREVQNIARLRHPNIVSVFEVGTIEGWTYFTMAYVPGRALSSRLRDTPLSGMEAASLMIKVARAIHHAHTHGIIHRDIKPANILLDEESNEPLVCDFGLAKNIESDIKLTQSGFTIGTPPYMPPEQARGQHDRLDSRSDVYALGATLFEFVTGRPPFGEEGQAGIQVLMQVVDKPAPRPRKYAPGVAPDLEAIILKCLSKKQSERYQNALLLAEDLERFLAGDWVLAGQMTAFAKLTRVAQSYLYRFIVYAAAIVLVASVALVVGGIINTPNEDPKPVRTDSRTIDDIKWRTASGTWTGYRGERTLALGETGPTGEVACVHTEQPLDSLDFELSFTARILPEPGANANLGILLSPTRVDANTLDRVSHVRPEPGTRGDPTAYADARAAAADRLWDTALWDEPSHLIGRGYAFDLGADWNTRSALTVDGVEVWSDPTLRLKPGKYKVRFTKLHRRLSLEVQETESRDRWEVSYEDDFPAALPSGGHLGFFTRYATVLISDLTLHTYAASAREIDSSDRLFALGQYEEAALDYRQKLQLARSRGDQRLARNCETRLALCDEARTRHNPAHVVNVYRTLLNASELRFPREERVRLELRLAAALLRSGSLAEAWQILTPMATDLVSSRELRRLFVSAVRQFAGECWSRAELDMLAPRGRDVGSAALAGDHAMALLDAALMLESLARRAADDDMVVLIRSSARSLQIEHRQAALTGAAFTDARWIEQIETTLLRDRRFLSAPMQVLSVVEAVADAYLTAGQFDDAVRLVDAISRTTRPDTGAMPLSDRELTPVRARIRALAARVAQAQIEIDPEDPTPLERLRDIEQRYRLEERPGAAFRPTHTQSRPID